MRKPFGVLAAGFCALGIAGPASAVPLDFTGSLTIEIVDARLIHCAYGSCNYRDHAPITVGIPGSGQAAVNDSGVRGHLTALGLSGGEFAIASHVVDVTDPYASPLRGVQITATNGAGAFSGAGGGAFGGVMPLHGTMKLCLFGPCASPVDNLTIPLSVIGQGGSDFFTGGVNLTVKGAPWTTGTASIGTPLIGTNTVMGGVSPLSSTGAPSGIVTLVTPVFISTNQPGTPIWGVRRKKKRGFRRPITARAQPVNATLSLNTSAGERKASVFRGRWFN